jgi:asparagine synthase (glutamine-hydrolysing)
VCGIAALFSSDPRPLGDLIQSMTTAVRHRGPDGEGLVIFSARGLTATVLGGVDTPVGIYDARFAYAPIRDVKPVSDAVAALGHRRLSIIDLTPAGHQPMCTQDRRYWIVYNGEIFNHVELRRELETLGYQFISTSDTEVILQAYRHWGASCLHRFNGMFAFVVLDIKERKVFAARDRFGVKPLYLWRSPAGLLAFASEIKQFTVLPGWQARMNGQRVYDFLAWGLSDHTRETLFVDVVQLRAGEVLEATLEELSEAQEPCRRVKMWYELSPLPFCGTFADAAKHLRELLWDSVRLRLRADVGVGSCLSGGIDSSSIVCLMSEILHSHGVASQQMTFSAVSTEGRLDERRFIRSVVERTGVDAHDVEPKKDELLQVLTQLVWNQDEPFGSASIYAQWCVFRLAARHGVKVMLDGQGADESFGGYHAFFGPRLAGLVRGLKLRDLAEETANLRVLHGYSFSAVIKLTLAALAPQGIVHGFKRLCGESAMKPSWLSVSELGARPADPFSEQEPGWRESMKSLSRSQLTRVNLSMLLHWEDRNSMAHSIEARVPFLDYRLVEFALGLPDEFKIKNGVTKYVLREAMRGTIPDMVTERMDKIGFEVAEGTWIRQSPDEFRFLLDSALTASHGVLAESARTVLDDFLEGRQRLPSLLIRLITFGLWAERFAIRA